MWVVPMLDIAKLPHSPLTPDGQLRKSFMKEFKSGKFVSLPNHKRKKSANSSKHLMKKMKKNVLNYDEEPSRSNNDNLSYPEHSEVTDSENSNEPKSVNLENNENCDPASVVEDDGISEYEKIILRNKRDKMAFLQALKIDEIKQELLIAPKKSVVKPIKRVQVKKDLTPLPRRKSLRLSKEKIDLSENAIFTRNLFRASHQETKNFPEEKPPNMKFEDALIMDNKDLCKDFAVDMSNLPEDTNFKNATLYNSTMCKTMKVQDTNIAKVVMSRISSMAIHPSSTKVLVAAGSKYGQIGLWDVESKRTHDGLYLFEPHSGNASCLAFNPDNHCQLFSSSYDGSFRCGDLNKMTFNEIYHSEEMCTYFDFLTSSTFLISQRNGAVVLVDSRINLKKINLKNHQSHNCALKTINIHPTDKSYFVTAGNNGIVSLWDLRKLQQTSVVDLHHNKCVNSAYFSPVNGNYILTTSTDDNIRIFDSKNMTEDIKIKVAIRHNNYVTRWLTCFRASWLPNSEENFVIGSMLFPRRIEIYNVNGNIVHNFEDENLNSITSTNVFHPSRPVLCGGNSSGKVYTFMVPQ